MAKYYHTGEDGKIHYEGSDGGNIAKPFIGPVHSFWDEIYKGEKNKNGERNGKGTMEWSLDTTEQWRFEEWATDKHFESLDNKYDVDDKLNPDRKLRGIKILFKGEWKDNYPHGDGKMYLNNKLFCEATWKGGSLHGKAKFKISKFTLSFGMNNNYLKIYSWADNEEDYHKEMKTDKHIGDFEGDCLYGLANGYGEYIGANGLSYKGEWRNGYPYGKGLKIYEDGREEFGEFGIIDQGTLKLMLDYIEEKEGQLIDGSRRFADGTSERVDKRTLYQKARSTIKDF